MSDDKDQPQVPFNARPQEPVREPIQETQPTQPLRPIAPIGQQPIPETQPIAPVGQQPTSVLPTNGATPDSPDLRVGYGQSRPATEASNGYEAYAVVAEQPQSPLSAVGNPTTDNGSSAKFGPTPDGSVPPQSPQSGIPAAVGAPETPQPGYAQTGTPQSGYPQPGASQPNGPYPPQTGYPQSGYPQPNGQPFNPREGKWNVCAIIGFVLAFVFSLAGLIVSIVGLNQIKKTHEKGRGLAIAGIVISIAFMLLAAIGGVAAYTAAMHQLTVSSSQSTSARSGAESDKVGKDLAKGLDELEQDGSNGSGSSDSSAGANGDITDLDGDGQPDGLYDQRYQSMSAMVADPTFQSEMQSSIGSSFEGTGATVTTRAEGDTLVIDIHLPSEYDAAASQLNSQLASTADGAMQPMADQLPSMVRTTGPAQVRMVVHTDAQTIFDKSYTASSGQ